MLLSTRLSSHSGTRESLTNALIYWVNEDIWLAYRLPGSILIAERRYS